MKILTVVGARPQFIKAAVVSGVLRRKHRELLLHTGQHFDYNMSEIFFREMGIPAPDYNLGISGGSHAEMTGRMMIAIEEVLSAEKPDMILLYGDTNSTMASALAAAKLHIPICHVEAGNRLGTLDNPEEVNRIVTDHVSSLLCCCTQSAYGFLSSEGLAGRAEVVGDPMYDAFISYSAKVGDSAPEKLTGLDGTEPELPEDFYYMTCHREENTRDEETLKQILDAMQELDAVTVYPVHPRNHKKVLAMREEYGYDRVIFCKPVGYLMSAYLVNRCKKVVTDSGGLQREAYFARKQCVTVFDHVVWPETMTADRNRLSQPRREEILSKLSSPVSFDDYDYPFGDGHSADKIVAMVGRYFEGVGR